MKESWVGKTLWGRFEIRAFLGEGGMGRVYRAWDGKLQRDVAVKMLKTEVQAQPLLERFRREAKTLARYTADPNLLTLFDFHEDRESNLLAILMEFVEGVSLRDLLSSGLAPEPLLQIVRQICHALERPHADGVIHRDIKPENVMVTKEGRVVLMDFGLAKCLSGGERITRPDHLVGTLAYMSPEQLGAGELSPASDVFALGVCLYEGLVGKHPFYAPGAPRDTLIAGIVNGRYEIPEGTIPDPALVAIVRGMLERDPHKRFPDARALGETLDRFFERAGLLRERSAIESALSASVGPLVRHRLSGRNGDLVPFDALAETLHSNGDEPENHLSSSLPTETLDTHGGARKRKILSRLRMIPSEKKVISSGEDGRSWNSRPTSDIVHPSVGKPVVGKLLPWILSGGALLLVALLLLYSGLRKGEDPGLAVAKRFSEARPLPAGKAGPGKATPVHLPRYRREGPAKLSAKTSEEAMLGITIWRLRRVAESDLSVAPELRLLSYDPDLGKEIEWVLERVPLGSRFSPGERIRLSVESNRPGYLYVVNQELYADGSAGDPWLIFPLKRFRNGFNFVEAGRVIEIPPREARLKFFTLSPTSISAPSGQIGERLSFLVSPTPLEIEVRDRPYPLDRATFERWKALWQQPGEHYEMEGGSGRLWSMAEKEAGADPERRLTLEDSTPQSIFRVAAGAQSPFLLDLTIRYAEEGTKHAMLEP